MRELPVTLYTGEMFDKLRCRYSQDDRMNLPRDSGHFVAQLRIRTAGQEDRSKGLSVTNRTLVKGPVRSWLIGRAVAQEQYPNGLPPEHRMTQLSGSSMATRELRVRLASGGCAPCRLSLATPNWFQFPGLPVRWSRTAWRNTPTLTESSA